MNQAGIAGAFTVRLWLQSLRLAVSASLVFLIVAGSGCVAAVTVPAKLIGVAVDHADVSEHKKVVIGAKVEVADERFGERLDLWRDVEEDRFWLVYQAQNDPLKKDRYVVEVYADRIIAMSRVEKNSDPKRDIPRALIIKDKVEGKTPAECVPLLDMGDPVVTMRSDFTGLLLQVYDARQFKNFGSPDYCMLRFDEDERCKEVEFMGVGASTEKEPMHGEEPPEGAKETEKK